MGPIVGQGQMVQFQSGIHSNDIDGIPRLWTRAGPDLWDAP